MVRSRVEEILVALSHWITQRVNRLVLDAEACTGTTCCPIPNTYCQDGSCAYDCHDNCTGQNWIDCNAYCPQYCYCLGC